MTDERQHLTKAVMDRMMAATKGQRHAARDRCLLLLMYRTAYGCPRLARCPWARSAKERTILRHGCGCALADQGADTRLIQDYLGYRNIQHTVRYTAANAARFGRLWR
jgi:site-specific recombinase XerD